MIQIKDSDIDYIVRYIKEDNCFRKANDNCSNSYFLSKIENAVHEIAANNSIEYLLALPDAVFNALPWYERGGTYENFEEFVKTERDKLLKTQQTAAIEGASGPQPGQVTDAKPEPKDGQGEGNETATRQHKYKFAYGDHVNIAQEIFSMMKLSSKKGPALADDCEFSTFLEAIQTADFRKVHFENKIKFLYGLSKIGELVWPSGWKLDLEPLRSPGDNGRAWDWKSEWDYLRHCKNVIDEEWKVDFDLLIEDIKNRKFLVQTRRFH